MTIDEAILDEIQKRNQPMDRDRALNILQNGLLPQVHGAYHEALDMAIKALEQEPCDDAISREYLVEHIKACWTNGRPMYSPDLSELLSWIDDVPLVQPKPIECEDTISRQAAIDTLIGWETELLDEDIERELRKLPSVTPRQAPCEEREKGECPFYAG